VRTLCSVVLGIEAIVVFLASIVAGSNGSVSSQGTAMAAGGVLAVLLLASIGTLGRSWGVWWGWAMQVLVLATAIFAGVTMLIVGWIFVILWYLAVRNGRRVDALRAQHAEQGS
jgi:hypothetical protein